MHGFEGSKDSIETFLNLWLLSVAIVDNVVAVQLPPDRLAQGAEILYIEDGYPRDYHLEDFFWTGSGDGSSETREVPWVDSEGQSTIYYKTKTILSTVFITATTRNQNDTEGSTACVLGCGDDRPEVPEEEITPTPVLGPDFGSNVTNVNGTNFTTADQHFWLLTVIKSGGKTPKVSVLELSLAKLYRTAFLRQQERHLGIRNRQKRQAVLTPDERKPIHVHILNISKNNDDVEVLYHVSVSEEPVPATIAASDMKLVTEDEASAELGFPIITKAEPYLKPAQYRTSARKRDTWLFIGAALAAVFILLLLVSLLMFILSKQKKKASGIANRQQVFDRERGRTNMGFVNEEEGQGYVSGRRKKSAPGKKQISTQTNQDFPTTRSVSSQSSTTSSGSLDISPLMTASKKYLPHVKDVPKIKREDIPNKVFTTGFVKNNLNETAYKRNILMDSDSSSRSTVSETNEVEAVGNKNQRISPKSYLSMPSVKSFPRGNIPEPLNRVLEPVSVLHFDIPDDVTPEVSPLKTGRPIVRHGSVGNEDPGVISPLVWDLQRQRLRHGVSVDEGIDDLKTASNAHRMRRRFHELLDDTFSLFGSRKESPIPEDEPQPPKVVPRGHSAVVLATETQPVPRPRPRTTDPRRVAPSPGLESPKGAWGSGGRSPLVRPLSAGVLKRPQVDIDRVLAEGTLSPTDPAVPLIAAIKNELEKCSLPGSTSNLAE